MKKSKRVVLIVLLTALSFLLTGAKLTDVELNKCDETPLVNLQGVLDMGQSFVPRTESEDTVNTEKNDENDTVDSWTESTKPHTLKPGEVNVEIHGEYIKINGRYCCKEAELDVFKEEIGKVYKNGHPIMIDASLGNYSTTMKVLDYLYEEAMKWEVICQ